MIGENCSFVVVLLLPPLPHSSLSYSMPSPLFQIATFEATMSVLLRLHTFTHLKISYQTAP